MCDKWCPDTAIPKDRRRAGMPPSPTTTTYDLQHTAVKRASPNVVTIDGRSCGSLGRPKKIITTHHKYCLDNYNYQYRDFDCTIRGIRVSAAPPDRIK